MARAIWTGSITFGLVTIPVKAYPAVHDEDLHFHQFDAKGDRVRQKRVSEKSGREVAFEDIVKGYEISKGNSVMFDPAELEKFEPRATKTIEIEDFVALDEIDPIYFEHTYYLVPDGEAAAKAYRLLLDAMEHQGRVGIGRVVMRTKQYLAAIRPLDGVLAMSTMLFADEVVPVKELPDLHARIKVPERERKMAEQIIDSLTRKWEPRRYHDTYRERVLEYLRTKAKGGVVEHAGPEPKDAEVVDLMAALEATLNARKKSPAKTGPATRKKTASGKSARRKQPA